MILRLNFFALSKVMQ